jgi:hypothetical protein
VSGPLDTAAAHLRSDLDRDSEPLSATEDRFRAQALAETVYSELEHCISEYIDCAERLEELICRSSSMLTLGHLREEPSQRHRQEVLSASEL